MVDFKIYQMPCNEENHFIVFESLDRLKEMGQEFRRGRYHLAYEGKMEPGTDLEELFYKLNMEHPKDYKARSLSVSDVVEITGDGETKAWFVDSFGFTDVTEVWKEAS